jgi:hypothetical protein
VPICGLWYFCQEYVFVECGHSYHPSYLEIQVSVHRKCRCGDYEHEFEEAWCVAQSIKPCVVETIYSALEKSTAKKQQRILVVVYCKYLDFLLLIVHVIISVYFCPLYLNTRIQNKE